jgi:hypothetical protein
MHGNLLSRSDLIFIRSRGSATTTGGYALDGKRRCSAIGEDEIMLNDGSLRDRAEIKGVLSENQLRAGGSVRTVYRSRNTWPEQKDKKSEERGC